MSIQKPEEVLAALDAAADRIRACVTSVIQQAPTLLLDAMRASATYRDRSMLAAAQNHLLLSKDALIAAFGQALRERMDRELAGTNTIDDLEPPDRETDWSSIGLVGEEQIQEAISFGRIGQFISHDCDLELRELSGYVSALLQHGRADPDRNPLRGAVIGWAMHRAIEKVTQDALVERTLGKQLGMLVAAALKGCYLEIIADLRSRGVVALALMARPAAESLHPGPGRSSPPDARQRDWEQSRFGSVPIANATDASRWEGTSWGGGLPSGGGAQEALPASSAELFERLAQGDVPAAMAARSPLTRTPTQAASDANLTALLRRLNQGIDSISGALGPALTELNTARSVNLITMHREALERASNGQLDHMVIEVVGGMFDQIFSDAQVPPQMVREIARLQLPVLRVAMRDPRFFASRRHPVRRFINRVSSLGLAIDDFSTGSGKALLERVHALIQQIVDGDFEQVDLYTAQLQKLEGFAAEQARAEIGTGAVSATLKSKEFEWQQFSRFAEDTRAALEPLPLEPYLKAFFWQIWTQVTFAISQRDGADSEAARQARSTGYELAVSTRPKRSPEERRSFIAGLVPLMKALNEGMSLIGWPQPERDRFFEKLMVDHTGALKAPSDSDLDHNLLLKRLQACFKIPLAAPDAAANAAPAPPTGLDLRATVFDQRFSDEEARSVGLIVETAVDWNRPVVQSPPPADEPPAGSGASEAGDAEHPESADVGPLRTRLEIGFSYHLQLKESWEKVRLTYMSPARNLFLFTHGEKDRRSISMTARMLDRLCESGRMRQIETAYLLDRASARVKRQLASLSPSQARVPAGQA